MPYSAAITCPVPKELVPKIEMYIGLPLPRYLVAELRFALLQRVRRGEIVLAGKAQPISAETPWHRFDETSLEAWDFRLDGTAWPLIGSGQIYANVTAFPPSLWRKIQQQVPMQRPGPEPRQHVVTWMRDAFKDGKRPKRANVILDCMRATGATDREAKAALAKIDDRPRRGRPRRV